MITRFKLFRCLAFYWAHRRCKEEGALLHCIFDLGVILIKFPNSDLSETLTAVRSWLRNATWRKQ
jgi:hypothetical protein